MSGRALGVQSFLFYAHKERNFVIKVSHLNTIYASLDLINFDESTAGQEKCARADKFGSSLKTIMDFELALIYEKKPGTNALMNFTK
ncbi:hypothetical protein ACTXT7_006066 [Hymenolepis weldensis]